MLTIDPSTGAVAPGCSGFPAGTLVAVAVLVGVAASGWSGALAGDPDDLDSTCEVELAVDDAWDADDPSFPAPAGLAGLPEPMDEEPLLEGETGPAIAPAVVLPALLSGRPRGGSPAFPPPPSRRPFP